ncbi:hypothetical protein CDD82_7717 [Ophiocordyceps australis]|uniref:Branched-chain-amino-acid aminotransferase n=1 Tax=Ophiocordyceps australis TaxID=1399860 RepID=A0A2C5ZPU9_9HYPO|nr:hypothetical protein CDD82_7717 [Ophiocordyceps australis]
MAEFPPAPVEGIDWDNVGFGVREVNGHIESSYSQSTKQWTPLRFVADAYMRIHGMSPALNYGQQAYEGLKAFRTPCNSICIFRPDRNAMRMQHSADVASMPRVPTELFMQAVRCAVAVNADHVPPHESGAALYLRPQLFGSSAQLGLSAPDEYTFCVFAVPTGVYHGTKPVRAFVLDAFDRAAPRGTGDAKVGGNYAPVLRWSDAARRDGYGITLHLDSLSHSQVDEFSTSAFVGLVADDSGITLVVPDSSCAIASITSDSVLQIARSFGWKTERRPVAYLELPIFAEVMAAGTAAALVPIRSITRRTEPEYAHLAPGPRVSVDAAAQTETVTYMDDEQHDPGPLCLRLLTQYKAIQSGKVDDVFGWRSVVVKADLELVQPPSGKNGAA